MVQRSKKASKVAEGSALRFVQCALLVLGCLTRRAEPLLVVGLWLIRDWEIRSWTAPRRGRYLRALQLVALLLVLAVNGWEASFWYRNDYPGALWHRKQPGNPSEAGIDIIWAQDRLPAIEPRLVVSFWFGESPYGFGGYYRPVTYTLYWLESQLFGTDDRLWCHLSIVLYLAVHVLLVWVVSVLRVSL